MRLPRFVRRQDIQLRDGSVVAPTVGIESHETYEAGLGRGEEESLLLVSMVREGTTRHRFSPVGAVLAHVDFVILDAGILGRRCPVDYAFEGAFAASSTWIA